MALGFIGESLCAITTSASGNLVVLVCDGVSALSGEFSAEHISQLTLSTGSYKRLDLFTEMLLSALLPADSPESSASCNLHLAKIKSSHYLVLTYASHFDRLALIAINTRSIKYPLKLKAEKNGVLSVLAHILRESPGLEARLAVMALDAVKSPVVKSRPVFDPTAYVANREASREKTRTRRQEEHQANLYAGRDSRASPRHSLYNNSPRSGPATLGKSPRSTTQVASAKRRPPLRQMSSSPRRDWITDNQRSPNPSFRRSMNPSPAYKSRGRENESPVNVKKNSSRNRTRTPDLKPVHSFSYSSPAGQRSMNRSPASRKDNPSPAYRRENNQSPAYRRENNPSPAYRRSNPGPAHRGTIRGPSPAAANIIKSQNRPRSNSLNGPSTSHRGRASSTTSSSGYPSRPAPRSTSRNSASTDFIKRNKMLVASSPGSSSARRSNSPGAARRLDFSLDGETSRGRGAPRHRQDSRDSAQGARKQANGSFRASSRVSVASSDAGGGGGVEDSSDFETRLDILSRYLRKQRS
ncbi:MAG: hypothetical protein SGCHY_003238 [Lobulomycetales sp.]